MPFVHAARLYCAPLFWGKPDLYVADILGRYDLAYMVKQKEETVKLILFLLSITLPQGPLYHPAPSGIHATVRQVVNTATLVVRIPGYDSQIPVRQYDMAASVDAEDKLAVLVAILSCDGVTLWNVWWDEDEQMLWADIYVCGVNLTDITKGAE